VERSITEIYVSDFSLPGVIRHDIDSTLNHTQEAIPLAGRTVWLAEDLDGDGWIELVVQYSDGLYIYSAPDWSLRASYTWPGMNVVMFAASFQLDEDPLMEVYATPNSLGGTGRVVFIDYDSVSGSFVKVVDILTPFGATGQPAIGDFDADGRLEFIWGNNDFSHELFEWQDPNLTYIGHIGDSIRANIYWATACRPKPGRTLHALLGYSDPEDGTFSYFLMEPTGDNEFQVVHTFQETTGFTGTHPCWAADVDCDGLDELVMGFHPVNRVWEWDDAQDQFVEGCSWDEPTYGTITRWYSLDLDRNGAPEWVSTAVPSEYRLYSFADSTCQLCDTTGHCPLYSECYCECSADPECDGVVNVLDVVMAVDVAFRSGSPKLDSYPNCPSDLTDVTCDSVTNVLDVVHFVNVAFRSAVPASEFCPPCQ
jgi:hypothetical protein